MTSLTLLSRHVMTCRAVRAGASLEIVCGIDAPKELGGRFVILGWLWLWLFASQS